MTEDLEELRKQTETGSRLDESLTNQGKELTPTIKEALKELDRGTRSNTIAIRDDSIEALLAALEETDSLDHVGATLQRELDQPVSENHDRSSIVRLAIRLGMASAEPDLVEQLGDAKAELARERI